MPTPTTEPLARLKGGDDVTRWADLLIHKLEEHLRDFRFPQQPLTLVNGLNNNVDPTNGLLLQIFGPTAPFTITGIANGVPGKPLVVVNLTTQNMTLANENASSQANNRIRTMSGADVSTVGDGAALLMYTTVATFGRWILVSLTT